MVKPQRSYTADFKVRVVLGLISGKINLRQASRLVWNPQHSAAGGGQRGVGG